MESETLKTHHGLYKGSSYRFAWIVFITVFGLTLTTALLVNQFLQDRMIKEFNFKTSEITQSIEDRMKVYEGILWNSVALFYTQKDSLISRQAFADYVEVLDIQNKWPGIQGIGFSIPITPSEKETHEALIRNEGFLEYSIRPEGERDLYSSIIYLEPFDWRNKRAFGFDMWSNALRREAMQRARDEGVAATSGLITLVQETSDDVQKGFLTYVPLYSQVKPSSLDERRSNFLGWVYAPFRANNLMQGIVDASDKAIAFQIYDGSDRQAESLLYSSVPPNEFSYDSNTTNESLNKVVTIELQGRPWTIIYENKILKNKSFVHSVDYLIAFLGLLINGLLVYLIRSFATIYSTAERIAKSMNAELMRTKNSLEDQVFERTKALEQAKEELNSKVEERTLTLKQKLDELEELQRLTNGREMRVIELKIEVNSLYKQAGETPPYTIQESE